MGMKIGLVPALSVDERTAFKDFLQAALRNERLCGSYPLGNGKVGIYLDGIIQRVDSGDWSVPFDATRIMVGRDRGNNTTPMIVRLGVLSALISLGNLWEELVDDFSAAVSRVLLESYNEMMSGLLQTRGATATGLAFTASAQQVAARFGETWHLPNGEGVDLTSPEWADATVVQ